MLTDAQTKQSDAYCMGFHAFARGEAITTNPYDYKIGIFQPGTSTDIRSGDWDSGYFAAQVGHEKTPEVDDDDDEDDWDDEDDDWDDEDDDWDDEDDEDEGD